MSKHSILVPYRNRPRQLKTFLESIDLPPDWEIVITDLGSTDESKEIIGEHQDRLTVRHLYVPYGGTFWRTKALNYALKRTEAEYVSVMDVDCIFSRNFFSGVQEYIVWHPDLKKLSYTVYRIPFPLVRHLVFDLPKDWYLKFHKQIIDQPERYPNPYYETIEGHRTGNSHFTMRKSDLLSVGAFDERYIGYGWEDRDLNMRLWTKFGDTVMFQEPIFQAGHQREANWHDPDCENLNRFYFEQAKEESYPPISVHADFGEFKEESGGDDGIR